jgi:CubicO group peptidase (beta-lactamase class C family)
LRALPEQSNLTQLLLKHLPGGFALEELAHTQDQDDGWVISRPEDESMDAVLLGGLAPQFDGWTDANVHAALIVRGGKLVYEHYFTGEDKAWATPLGRVSYHYKLRHDLRSITKSVTSLLFGMAVDRGWIKDLDESVFSFFPEQADLRTADKDRINLRHLLTMSAGFAWNEYLPYSDPANSERRMIDALDQCRYVLEQPIARPPGVAYVRSHGDQ